ncbi:MAG: GNAT family N-acetyltransferase [Wenzhouxiangellaceae bacterium]|nr:GNAT family N-acetyltransferase [Wenzhouxiangellaceae bacterium]
MSVDWSPILDDPASGIVLRPFDETDLPFLEQLFASTREAEFAILPWTEEQRRAFMKQQFQAQHRHYIEHYPDADFLVIEQQGRPIGRIYLDLGAEELRLMEISLLPEQRGLGLGGAMLERLCRHADRIERGIGLHVEAHNPAVRLYSRLGFRQIENRGIYDYMLRPVTRQENTAS